MNVLCSRVATGPWLERLEVRSLWHSLIWHIMICNVNIDELWQWMMLVLFLLVRIHIVSLLC